MCATCAKSSDKLVAEVSEKGRLFERGRQAIMLLSQQFWRQRGRSYSIQPAGPVKKSLIQMEADTRDLLLRLL
jgi:hypothetical protein